MDTWFLRKNPKWFNRKKKASSIDDAGLAGYWHGEECKYMHICHPAPNSSPNGSQV